MPPSSRTVPTQPSRRSAQPRPSSVAPKAECRRPRHLSCDGRRQPHSASSVSKPTCRHSWVLRADRARSWRRLHLTRRMARRRRRAGRVVNLGQIFRRGFQNCSCGSYANTATAGRGLTHARTRGRAGSSSGVNLGSLHPLVAVLLNHPHHRPLSYWGYLTCLAIGRSFYREKSLYETRGGSWLMGL